MRLSPGVLLRLEQLQIRLDEADRLPETLPERVRGPPVDQVGGQPVVADEVEHLAALGADPSGVVDDRHVDLHHGEDQPASSPMVMPLPAPALMVLPMALSDSAIFMKARAVSFT